LLPGPDDLRHMCRARGVRPALAPVVIVGLSRFMHVRCKVDLLH